MTTPLTTKLRALLAHDPDGRPVSDPARKLMEWAIEIEENKENRDHIAGVGSVVEETARCSLRIVEKPDGTLEWEEK